jgi:MFS family permease
VQKISLAASGVILLALAQVRSIAGILPLLFSLSMLAAMLYPANAALMSKICPAALQVKGFALNRLAGNLGATIGPAVGGVLALRDYRLLFWAESLTSLSAAALLALLWKGNRLKGEEVGAEGTGAALRDELRIDGDTGPGKEATKLRSPWRDGPFLLLMLIFLIWYAIFLQVLTTFPLYVRNVYGLAENRIGQLFAVNTVIIVALEMILMERIRKYPLTRMMNVSFILLGAGLGLMPFGRGFAFGALTVAIWTFGEMLSMPLSTALVAGRADDTNRGRYLGLSSLVFSLAFIVAPSAGTAIYDRFGGDAVWIVSAALSFLLAVAFSFLRPAL